MSSDTQHTVTSDTLYYESRNITCHVNTLHYPILRIGVHYVFNIRIGVYYVFNIEDMVCRV